MRRKLTLTFFTTLIAFSCNQTKLEEVKINTSQGMSLLNTPLIRRQVDVSTDSLQIINYLEALDNYETIEIGKIILSG